MPENSENELKEITDSILNSVKKQLGLFPENSEFDAEILMNINSAFFTLSQLGIGPEKGFFIEGPETTYEDYLGDRIDLINSVKMYIYRKTKLGFDITTTPSSVIEVLKSQIAEDEVSLLYQVDVPRKEVLSWLFIIRLKKQGGFQNGINNLFQW